MRGQASSSIFCDKSSNAIWATFCSASFLGKCVGRCKAFPIYEYRWPISRCMLRSFIYCIINRKMHHYLLRILLQPILYLTCSGTPEQVTHVRFSFGYYQWTSLVFCPLYSSIVYFREFKGLFWPFGNMKKIEYISCSLVQHSNNYISQNFSVHTECI